MILWGHRSYQLKREWADGSRIFTMSLSGWRLVRLRSGSVNFPSLDHLLNSWQQLGVGSSRSISVSTVDRLSGTNSSVVTYFWGRCSLCVSSGNWSRTSLTGSGTDLLKNTVQCVYIELLFQRRTLNLFGMFTRISAFSFSWWSILRSLISLQRNEQFHRWQVYGLSSVEEELTKTLW